MTQKVTIHQSITTNNQPFCGANINQRSSDKLKKNNFYKPLIVVCLSLSLIGLVSLPSWGLLGLQIGNYSISVDLKLDKLWKGWQAKLQQSLNQALGQISSLGDMGALGLPDPIAIRRDIEKVEGFEGWDESNEIDRIYTEILASETSSKTVDKEQRYQEEQQQARANATLEILGYAALYK